LGLEREGLVMSVRAQRQAGNVRVIGCFMTMTQ
jgi:hypothetical protein